MRLIIRLSSVALLLLIAGIGGVIYIGAKPGPHDEPKMVWVKSGMSVASIARSMEQDGILYDWRLMMLKVRATGAIIKAGEYEIPARASSFEVLDILRFGKPVLHSITIPEGLTSAEVVARLNADEILSGEIETLPDEGTLLPETYSFERGADRQKLLERMARAQDRVFERLWEGRVPHPAIQTRRDALIVASIVEKETGVGSERAKVAGVYLNRLKIGMKLDADPTVIYGIEQAQGKPMDRPLWRKDLKFQSPYNTYLNPGLPPGPIANPGRASIEAVLNPAETKAYYFVADGTGGHVFARTLSEHNRNVAKWRRIKRERAN